MSYRILGRAVIASMLLLRAVAAMAQGPELKVGDWAVFKVAGAECWAVTDAIRGEGPAPSDKALFMITVFPSAPSSPEPAFRLPEDMREVVQGQVFDVRIDETAFRFFGHEGWAFAASKDDQEAIVAAALKGARASLQVRRDSSDVVTYAFSLTGAAGAVAEALRCIGK